MQPTDNALQAEKLAKELYNIYQSGEDKTVLILNYADKTEQVRLTSPPVRPARSGDGSNNPAALRVCRS